MSSRHPADEAERRKRNQYIWRTWVLGSVPMLLVIALWIAWDSGFTLRDLFTLRFLAVLGAGFAAASIVGYFVGRLFWSHGLAPDDEDR